VQLAIVFMALARMNLIMMRRYAFDWIARAASSYFLFAFAFAGYSVYASSRTSYGSDVEGLTIGILVFGYAVGVFYQLSTLVMQEAAQGTLEQLAMNPFGLSGALFMRTTSHAILHLGVTIALLFCMMATTGLWLSIDFVSFLPLLLISAISIQGAGLAVAGLAILFKRIQSAFFAFQVSILALAFLPSEGWLQLAPLSYGAEMIRRVSLQGQTLADLSLYDWTHLCLVSVAWVLIGFLAFELADRKARTDALLGHY